MFSFFRKGAGDTKPAIPKDDSRPVRKPSPRPGPKVEAPQPPPAQAPSPAVSAQPPEPPAPPPQKKGSGGIQVQEMDIQLVPEVEEAVMHYANGHVGEATAALNRYILDHQNGHNPQAWLLLFDIYEATGQRTRFEDLAVDFAVLFERSPPTWRSIHPSEDEPGGSASPIFAFGPNLPPQDKAKLEYFLKECEPAKSVVLDFSKTPVPGEDSYAKTMLDTLSRLIESGKEVRINGGAAFIVRLNASRFGGKLSESTWLLLMMLLQLQGKADEFDEAALEYAVRFEMSPPSYVAPKHVAREPELPETDLLAGNVFPMRGVLDSGSTEVFAELKKHAENVSEVDIDLSQVERIDFAVVGLLMETLMSLTQEGKQVMFQGGNGMVNLFLQLIGAGQFATIQYVVRK